MSFYIIASLGFVLVVIPAWYKYRADKEKPYSKELFIIGILGALMSLYSGVSSHISSVADKEKLASKDSLYQALLKQNVDSAHIIINGVQAALKNGNQVLQNSADMIAKQNDAGKILYQQVQTSGKLLATGNAALSKSNEAVSQIYRSITPLSKLNIEFDITYHPGSEGFMSELPIGVRFSELDTVKKVARQLLSRRRWIIGDPISQISYQLQMRNVIAFPKETKVFFTDNGWVIAAVKNRDTTVLAMLIETIRGDVHPDPVITNFVKGAPPYALRFYKKLIPELLARPDREVIEKSDLRFTRDANNFAKSDVVRTLIDFRDSSATQHILSPMHRSFSNNSIISYADLPGSYAQISFGMMTTKTEIVHFKITYGEDNANAYALEPAKLKLITPLAGNRTYLYHF